MPGFLLTPIGSITSYGERPNEFDAVVGYFRAHFTQVHKRNNENMRVLYTHLTNVVVRSSLSHTQSRLIDLTFSTQDKTATRRIITDIRDSIFRVYLKDAALV